MAKKFKLSSRKKGGPAGAHKKDRENDNRGRNGNKEPNNKDPDDSNRSLMDVASLYASAGLAVVPLHGTKNGRCTCGDADCRRPGRHPRPRHGLDDATTERPLIEEYWQEWPRARIGVALGTPSRLLALIIEGAAGKESLRKLQRANHNLKKTVTIRDASRRIRLFRVPGDYVVRHKQLDAGLRVLGDGDLLVMPSGTRRKKGPRFVSRRALNDIGFATAANWFRDHASRDTPHVTKVFDIRIDDVLVGDRRRSLNPEKVAELAESMKTLSQKTAITVRPVAGPDDGKCVLVAGLHRIKAAESLGWTHIRAEFMTGDETDARLWEIAENLHRAELTALEHDEQVAEWVRLTEARRVVSGQIVHKPGRPKGGIAEAARRLPVTGKTQHARRKTVERSIKVASVSPEAKAAAKEAGLDDHRSAMLEIAKQKTPEAQIQKVHQIVARKAASRGKGQSRRTEKRGTVKANEAASDQALSADDNKKLARLIVAWNNARKLRRAFAKASAIVRERFFADILESADVQEEPERVSLTEPNEEDKKPEVSDTDQW